jgi:hypothetical protein
MVRRIQTSIRIPLASIQERFNVIFNIFGYTWSKNNTANWSFEARLAERTPLNTPGSMNDEFTFLATHCQIPCFGE